MIIKIEELLDMEIRTTTKDEKKFHEEDINF